MLSSIIHKFIKTEAGGGLLLMIAAALALIVANSPLQEYYSAVFSHDVLFFINDGLMVLFFLLVGMEIKRELLEGELSSMAQALLPASAALGGVLFPALLYVLFNLADTSGQHGWATASATDIAFSLCVLSLCGAGIPASLRMYLTAIAVIDDLAAIIIIALFYTDTVSVGWLGLAAVILIALGYVGRRRVNSLPVYMVLGVMLWLAVLASGVHATIAGVLLGLMMPLKMNHPSGTSMLLRLEHALHPWVSYTILPLFAFANAGVRLSAVSLHSFAQPVTLGIIAGLFLGKQAGITLFTFLPIMMGMASKPKDATWLHLYGVSLLAGIGFTMSLFIGGLAFGEGEYFAQAKVGIIAGSLLSAVAGYAVLRFTAANRR